MMWHIFIETTIILLMFKEWNSNIKSIQKLCLIIIVINIILFFFFSFGSTFILQDTIGLYSFTVNLILSFLSLAMVIYLYFHSLYNSLLEDKLFIMSSALILYNGLQIYVSVFESTIRKDSGYLFLIIWPIVQLSTIIYHILITRTIWILKKAY